MTRRTSWHPAEWVVLAFLVGTLIALFRGWFQ